MPRRSKAGEQQAEGGLKKKFGSGKHSAADSIQPHMLYSRKEIRQLVMQKLTNGVPPQNVTDEEPFQYAVLEGQLYVKLKRPMLRDEVGDIVKPVSEALHKLRAEWKEKEGITRKYVKREHMPSQIALPEHLEFHPKKVASTSEDEDEDVGVEGSELEETAAITGEKAPGLGKLMFGKFPILALTSKMGCYSFNLPAGPASHQFYGTCQAAAYGFPMLTDKERPRAGSKWLDETSGKHLTREDFSTKECDKKGKCFADRFLCSGCYGLKGLYGSPMIFTMMECRKQWIETMIHDKYRKKLIEMLVKAIRMSQAQSIMSRFFLTEMGLQDQLWTIPDPAYFRIHDVGDVFDQRYLEAWFQVIRECANPMRVKKMGLVLPAIKFWMPTRAWAVPGKVSDHFKCMGIKPGCVPENLTIRPSAMHFDDAAPKLKGAKGLAIGSGATGMSQRIDDKDVQAAGKVVGKLYKQGGHGWICPAYLAPDPEYGGGAEWMVKGKKHKSLQLVGGACARARGPDGEKECRACWDRPDLAIVYPEH